MKSQLKSDLFLFAAVLCSVAFFVFAGWLMFAAPCRYMGFLPVKDVPSRCFMLDSR